MLGGSGHDAACCCATCAAEAGEGIRHHAGHTPGRGHAIVGYGAPNGGSGDALVGGRIWVGKTLTLSFPGDAVAYNQNHVLDGVQYGDGEPTRGFTPRNASRENDAAPASAYAYYPDTDAEGGDVWFGSSRGYYDNPSRGDYAWHAFLHELGHSVGLKHGHDQGVIGAGGPLEADRDRMEWSVMSYRSHRR